MGVEPFQTPSPCSAQIRTSTTTTTIRPLIMSDKAKSKELFDLCFKLFYDKASFDDIQEWLDNNKDNQDLLIQAANYRDIFN
jgi:hypothetical protein